MKSLFYSEDAFERLPIPEWLKASIGGAAVGTIAILVPNVFGVGYSTIAEALEGNLPLAVLGVFLIAKIVATSITIGSSRSSTSPCRNSRRSGMTVHGPSSNPLCNSIIVAGMMQCYVLLEEFTKRSLMNPE